VGGKLRPKVRCDSYQESRLFLPSFVQVARRRGGSREAARRKIGEEDHMEEASGEGLAYHTRAYIEGKHVGYTLGGD